MCLVPQLAPIYQCWNSQGGNWPAHNRATKRQNFRFVFYSPEGVIDGLTGSSCVVLLAVRSYPHFLTNSDVIMKRRDVYGCTTSRHDFYFVPAHFLCVSLFRESKVHLPRTTSIPRRQPRRNVYIGPSGRPCHAAEHQHSLSGPRHDLQLRREFYQYGAIAR